ncbi:MAG TPA: hypothetical protein VGH72_33760 [Pseudonocardia sp.]
MAATNVPVQQLNSESPSVMSIDSWTPVACDATNGNSITNDGETHLFFTATAADTVTVSFPGVSHTQTVAVASGHLGHAGPFEVDEYGPTVVFKAGAATTLVTPLALPPFA